MLLRVVLQAGGLADLALAVDEADLLVGERGLAGLLDVAIKAGLDVGGALDRGALVGELAQALDSFSKSGEVALVFARENL
jgi:hypothetical protein